jgi:hypothetical protein
MFSQYYSIANTSVDTIYPYAKNSVGMTAPYIS